MSIFDNFKQLLGGVKSGTQSVDDLKAKGQDLATQYGDTINKVVDVAQDKIPGTTGDTVVDGLQEKLGELSDKK
jgi:hypothetical protein